MKDLAEKCGGRNHSVCLLVEVASHDNPKFHLTDLDLKRTSFLGAEKQMAESTFWHTVFHAIASARGEARRRQVKYLR